MPQTTRTFRIFVSSTFSDLKAERSALQEQVFPRLRELCARHTARFQPIDLRWGVSEEAALDQQTMSICLGEIERCQQVSPRPNFLIMLGDRFGWRPLPAAIPAAEFERLLPFLSEPEYELAVWREDQPVDQSGWYRRDENAVPPEYILLPRQHGTPFDVYNTWASQVERPLVAALERAAHQVGLDDAALAKYSLSATGQEILHGALQVADADQHVFAYFRTLTNPTEASQSSNGQVVCEADPGLAQRQQNLKDRLRACLPDNIYNYTAEWQPGGLTLAHIGALPASLDDCLALNQANRPPANLCEAVWLRLSQVILAEIKAAQTQDPLEQEQAAHLAFAQARLGSFTGRADLLAQLAGYLSGAGSRPLAVIGPSGSGKSTLLAKAFQQALVDFSGRAVVAARFIGASAESASARALLESLCRQVSRAYQADESKIPTSYRDLVGEFPRRLALASPARPLLIFIDALDQLSDEDQARSLSWLPAELPPGVKLVVSSLPGECQAALHSKLPAASLLSVPALSRFDGAALLQAWLQTVNRTLTFEQRESILARFERSGGLPLYLKLAFEEARRWRAFSGLTALSDDIPGLLGDFFQRLEQENHHGQALVSCALGCLSAARRGLSEDELLDLLWQDPDLRKDFFRRSPMSPKVISALPVVIWARLYADLAPYLTVRQADGVELITFYHRQVGEAARARWGAQLPAAHERLAGYFAGQPLWLDPTQAQANCRKVSELPYQLAYAGQGDALVAALTDFAFLRATLQATDPASLIENFGLYQIAEARITGAPAQSLALIHQTLQLSAFALSQNKELLAGQLLGRLADYDRPEILHLLSSVQGWTDQPWLRPISACLPPPGGGLMRTLGEQQGLLEIQITLDSQRAISSSSDQITIWDLVSGRSERVFRGMHALAFASEPYTVLRTSTEYDPKAKTNLGILEVIDFQSGVTLRQLRYHQYPIVSFAVTPDGLKAISAARVYKWKDNTIKVWEVASGRCLQTIKGEAEKVMISPDGRRGVSIIQQYPITAIKIWNLDNGKLLQEMDDFQGAHLATLTPDGRRLVYALSQGRGLKVVDLTSGKPVFTLAFPSSNMRNFTIAPDGRQALIEGTRYRSQKAIPLLQIWDLTSGQLSREFEDIQGILAISPSGEQALDRTLRLWDLKTGVCLRSVSAQPYEAKRIAFTPDGKQAVSWAESDNAIRQWQLDANQGSFRVAGHADQVRSLARLPDGRHLASSSADQTVKLWELDSGRCVGELIGHYHWVRCVAAMPDGRRVITGSDDKTLKVWDWQTGQCLHTMGSSKNMSIHHMSLSPDGRLLLVGAGYSVDLWDFSAEKPACSFLGLHKDSVGWVAITPDGRLGVTVDVSQSKPEIIVWDLAQRQLAHNLAYGHFTSQALLPDGRRLLTADDKTAVIWDLASGERLRTLEITQAYKLASLVIPLPQANQLAVFSLSSLSLFDLDSGACLGITSINKERGLYAGAIAPDGKYAVTRDYDGRVEIWDMARLAKATEFISEGQTPAGGKSSPGMVITSSTLVFGDQTGRVYFLKLENAAPPNQTSV